MSHRSSPSQSVLLLVALLAAHVSCASPTATPAGAAEEALVGRPAAGQQVPVQRGTLWYAIRPRPGLLDVRVRLLQPPDQTRFFLPGRWAGRDDFARRIAIGGARGPEGARFLTIDRKEGRVDVDARGADWIELHYTVTLGEADADPEDRLSPRMEDGALLAFGPTFLVLPSQQILERTRDIPIEVHTPSSGYVHTTWQPRRRSTSRLDPTIRVHGFLASDARALRDTFIVVGDSLRLQAMEEGEELVEVAFSPAFRGDTAGIVECIGAIVAEYRDLFGPLGPIRVYVRTRDGSARETGGLGRRGGFVVELPPDAVADADTALLLAHEALHLWNGHHLVPEPDEEAKTRWFKEGITHYLALKTVRHLGRVDQRRALEELALSASNYMRNPLAAGRAGSALDLARFPYDRGVLLGVALDTAFGGDARSHGAGGSRGLATWLVALRRRVDDTGARYYRESTLLEALREASGDDPAALAVWDRHVRRGERLDPAAIFAAADLHWLAPDDRRGAKLIGIDRPAPLYRRLLPGPEPDDHGRHDDRHDAGE